MLAVAGIKKIGRTGEGNLGPKREVSFLFEIFFLDIFGLYVAQYFGFVAYSVLSYVPGKYGFGEGLFYAFFWAWGSFIFAPFFFVVTWKAALVAIVIGEVVRRVSYYYPMAGIIAGYWISQNYTFARGRFDPFIITVSGGVAGYVFWYVAVKWFDLDWVTALKTGAKSTHSNQDDSTQHRQDAP